MDQSHPLDRPAWSALKSGWLHLAQGNAQALRLDPAYGPFGAAADRSEASLLALAGLIPAGGQLWAVEADALQPISGTAVLREAPLHQMVAERLNPLPAKAEILALGDEDAEEMRALAHLTEPGPFFEKTHKLGSFVGIRKEGVLVAMAGERMKIKGFSEVSGVCTHPDHRGHGYAGMLMSIVTERIFARGETAFLHSYASNAGAIALYERLGFVLRKELNAMVLGRA